VRERERVREVMTTPVPAITSVKKIKGFFMHSGVTETLRSALDLNLLVHGALSYYLHALWNHTQQTNYLTKNFK
jgi:hypothetical protein